MQLPVNFKEKFNTILISKAIHNIPWVIPFVESNFPLNISTLFPNYTEYVLEIGSGWGEFTIDYAQKKPQSFTMALEKKKKRIVRSAKEQNKINLTNIRWLVLNIDWFFDSIFTENSFHKIVVNFPDPWPKKRHQKHRFVSNDFLNSITKFGNKNCIFEFATDHWEYLEEVLYLFENSHHWNNIHGKGSVLPSILDRKQSYFEITTKSEGKHTYFLQFIKNKNI